jgi:tetratricopeptide (TPR) repeat protein
MCKRDSFTLALLLVSILWVTLPNKAVLAEQPAWRMQDVVLKRAVTHLHVSPGKPETFSIDPIFTAVVEHDRGSWFSVRSGEREGWLPRSSAVLLREAVPHFSVQLQRNPKDIAALYARAAAYERQGKFDLAIKDIDAAIGLVPGEWPREFASSPYNIRAQLWQQKGDSDKALKDFAEAIRLAPDQPQAYFNRARLWESRGAMDQALADYNRAIERAPEHAPTYAYRGRLYSNQGKFEKALRDYDSAIRLEPRNASYRFRSAFARWILGQTDTVIADCTEAIRLDKEFSLRGRPHTVRALTWRSKKEYRKALADFEVAFGHDPTDELCLQGMVCLFATCPLAQYRDGKRAVKLARQLIEAAGARKNPLHMQLLAAAYAETGDFKHAIAWQKKALQELSAWPVGYRERARQQLKLYEQHTPYRED